LCWYMLVALVNDGGFGVREELVRMSEIMRKELIRSISRKDKNDTSGRGGDTVAGAGTSGTALGGGGGGGGDSGGDLHSAARSVK
jgi:hypothetical protein